MPPVRPSLELLRELSDEHVLRALLGAEQLTRAEIAAVTGLSKPTVSESVRRLEAAGIVHDTGARTTGRGRVGTYYALAPGLGTALVVSIAPEGIVAETVSVRGEVVARTVEKVARPTVPEQLEPALRTAARAAVRQTSGPARLAVVSAADPVDRVTGRLVHLPDAPFLVGELAPTEVLARYIDGPVSVDNDVHWAARAERAAAGPGELDNAAYLWLGEGLGGAIISDGVVVRGRSGLAGEVAYVLTRGRGGRATRYIDVFADLGLQVPGSSAVDIPALTRALAASHRVRTAVADAIAGVVGVLAAVADVDPVVLGGPWGGAPGLAEAVVERARAADRPVAVRTAAVVSEPALTGARHQAVLELQSLVATGLEPSARPAEGVS